MGELGAGVTESSKCPSHFLCPPLTGEPECCPVPSTPPTALAPSQLCPSSVSLLPSPPYRLRLCPWSM